ncbi:MAG: alpha-galactosidase [Kiritimatiellae bacterium]|nr:alpha-galactosidase [Kiritimatiellia bacterium]
MNYPDMVTPDELQDARQWLQELMPTLGSPRQASGAVDIRCIRQGWGELRIAKSVVNGTLCLNGRGYEAGLGTHADSEIQIRLPQPGKRLTGLAGVDDNLHTATLSGDAMVFSVEAAGQTLWRSGAQEVKSPPARLDVNLGGRQALTLRVAGAVERKPVVPIGHADWVDLEVTLDDGQVLKIGEYHEPGRGLSFRYDNRHSDEFLSGWDRREEHRPAVHGIALHRVIRTDPGTGLQLTVEIKEYTQFPVVEWLARYKNTGTADTPILEDIRSLDIQVRAGTTLHYDSGDTCSPDGYEARAAVLDEKTELTFAPLAGRPTAKAWPYYNIEYPVLNRGLILVVGWSGQWASRFTGDADRGVRITAGQELTHLRLQPGEEIRTPVSVLMFWRGDLNHAHNLWRRWMMACNMPRPGGKLPAPMLPGYSGFWFEEMGRATEGNQKQFIDRYAEKGITLDYWWMDAGWYPCQGSWVNTGTWEVDAQRFPRGLRAVSDHAHRQGVKTIVWFEPERVVPGTWLAERHPEWLLTVEGQEWRLLDLGNSEARQWLTNQVDGILTEQGIDIYRQDFNFGPLPYWRAHDAPDRQGMTEIRHVEGYLAYWDELRRRHPDMLIDSCSGGGGRNDLETMRRAVPLHRTDYGYGDFPVKQAFTHTLSRWLPFQGTMIHPVACVDVYGARSSMCPSLLLNYDVRRDDLDYALLCQLIAEWRRIAPFYSGDYYPLTAGNHQDDLWLAWQFHDPDCQEGVIQAFRRPNSPYETARFKLGGLEAAATYVIENLDQPGQILEQRGHELMNPGFAATLPEGPQAGIWIYRRKRCIKETD